MTDEIQLISDVDGLAVIGNPMAVERFLDSMGLLSSSKDLGLHGLGGVLRTGSAVVRAASEVAANSGRWVKLTEESRQAIEEFGLTPTKTPGIDWAMAGQPGSIKSWIKIETGTGSLLANPARLAGIAGIMAQVARRQEINEIKAYLVSIATKVDSLLDAQKHAELAKVIGAGLDIRFAMRIRERTRRVDEVTWSTVQGRTQTITDAQEWALLRLRALAEKVGSQTKIGDLARTAKETGDEVRELLAVLARCFELQDALDVLRLDRVLDASPGDLDGHRLALLDDRQVRRQRISRETEGVMTRMEAAAGMANLKVLLHPGTSRAVLESLNQVGSSFDDFHLLLGIESGWHPLEATRWVVASRDRAQWKNAATEAGPRLAVAAMAAATVPVAKRVVIPLARNVANGFG
jgi:hypothetical protein